MRKLEFIQVMQQDFLNQVKQFSEHTASFFKGMNTVFNSEIIPKFS